MKNKSFALKAAAAAVVLLGAAMSAQAGSGSASVGVQLNALAVGTCTVTPDAANFALPPASIGDSLSAYVAANFTVASVNPAVALKTNPTLKQTFKLMCGSTTSITSMTILPVNGYTSYPSMGFIKDSAGKSAFSTAANPSASGAPLGADLVSINGASTPFSFVSISSATPSYTTAFSVGTAAVPVEWQPVMYTNSIAGAAPLTSPANLGTGYKTDFVITINY